MLLLLALFVKVQFKVLKGGKVSQKLKAPKDQRMTQSRAKKRRPRQKKRSFFDWSSNIGQLAFGTRLYTLTLKGKIPDALSFVPADPWPGNAVRGKLLINGTMRFARQSFEAGRGNWKPLKANQDWLFAAHSFHWLRDLRAVGGDAARRKARTLVLDWLDHFENWDEIAWRPEIIGARLATWIAMHDFFCASADDRFRMRLFDAIQCQSRHLQRMLPATLSGAPLILAYKGLTFSGLALPQAQNRLISGVRGITRELSRQILPDGGHIERNPTEQLWVLRHLVDVRSALAGANKPMPEALQHAIDKMAPMLRFYRHGDGKLCLFNGGGELDPVMIDMVLNQSGARGRPLQSAPHSGYERMTMGRVCVYTDVGSPPIKGYNRHAHAGALSFEMSVGRERIVVNCGHAGLTEKRNPLSLALRTSAAHSTLVVTDTNIAPLSSGGQIGRQPAHVTCERNYSAKNMILDTSHNGYQEKFGLVHKRRFHLMQEGDLLEGQDCLVGEAGHDFAIRFHLHPDVTASRLQGGKAVIIRTRGGHGWRFEARGMNQIKIEESLYQPDLEQAPRQTSQIVLYGSSQEANTRIIWMFQREKKPQKKRKKKIS
jgi:uncharacterized heparinase superfamily protein